MGATTRDIFGQADTAEPATPGTYGEPPGRFRLPEQVRVGPVSLQVSDLALSVAFYQDVLGLRPLDRDSAEVTLAPQENEIPLVHLRARRGARAIPKRGALGLYHFAILLPDRPSLGRFVRHLGGINAPAGAGDHLVSESLYLQDPDNLGIEVYADRPRSTWRRIGRELMMATDPVDFAGLIEAAGQERWSGMPAGTTMGHLHLHVGAWSGPPPSTLRGSASIGWSGTTPARCFSPAEATTIISVPTPGRELEPCLRLRMTLSYWNGPSRCRTHPTWLQQRKASGLQGLPESGKGRIS